MRGLPSFQVLVAVVCLTLPGSAQETHLREAGSGTIFSRSAFAHGYRHGYEEGYHVGNVDINMGRPARADKKQFHGVKLSAGYSSGFGPKRSFEAGFQAGLAAGYTDGYAGRAFRAVDSARALAAALEGTPPPADPANLYFDRGVASGYREGFQQGDPSKSPAAPLDFRQVACTAPRAENQPDSPARTSYCEGFRRGFVLGRADALALHADFAFLEANK